MTQIRSGGGAPAAVLAGSLAVFPLLDVLGLLGRTRHAGELHVVSDGVEARLEVEDGGLLANPASAADRLFDLACLDDAWFTVSSSAPGQAGPSARPPNRERLELQPLIEQVAPHVAEWRSLMKALPFGAVARMSPAMPGPEAQILSDQWRILSLIGTGRPVHEVIDVSEGRPLHTLRLVHELAQKELIMVELPPAGTRRRTRPPRAPSAHAGGPPGEPGEAAGPPPDGEGERGNGPELEAVAATPRTSTTPLTVKRPATVRAAVADTAGSPSATADGAGRRAEPKHRPAPGGTAAPRAKGHHAVAAYMPPPVTPSSWPLALAMVAPDAPDGAPPPTA